MKSDEMPTWFADWQRSFKLDLLREFDQLINEKVKVEVQREIRKIDDERQAQFGALHDRITSLENHSRRANIEILGLPVVKNEDINQILLKLGETIGFPLKGQILKAHRVASVSDPRKLRNNRPPPVVAELRNRNIQEVLLEKVKSLFKTGKIITAGSFGGSEEDRISVIRQWGPTTKALFRSVRNRADEKGYSFKWIAPNGTILVRKNEGDKAIVIKSEFDLKKII